MKKFITLFSVFLFILLYFFVTPNQVHATVTNINILSPTNAAPVSVHTNSTTTITYAIDSDSYSGYQCYVRLLDKNFKEIYSQACDVDVFPVGEFYYDTVLNIGSWTENLYHVMVEVVGNTHDTENLALGIDDTAPTVPTVLYPSDAGIYIPGGGLSTTSISWTQSTDAVIFKDKPISIEFSLLGDFSDAFLIGTYDATPTSIT